MITGAHVMIFSRDAEADRQFFKDILGFDSVDAGGGWLIFALPPAELAVHPAEENDRHELYLMCADLAATMASLQRKGVVFRGPIQEPAWGRLVQVQLAGGGVLGIYQPNHPVPAPAITKG